MFEIERNFNRPYGTSEGEAMAYPALKGLPICRAVVVAFLLGGVHSLGNNVAQPPSAVEPVGSSVESKQDFVPSGRYRV